MPPKNPPAKLTVHHTVARLRVIVRRLRDQDTLPEFITSSDCQDLAQAAGVRPVHNEHGVEHYRTADIIKALDWFDAQTKHEDLSPLLEQALDGEELTDDEDDLDSPPLQVTPPKLDSDEDDEEDPVQVLPEADQGGWSRVGLPRAVVEQLRDNGIETPAALQTFIDSGNALTSLNGIGNARCTQILNALRNARTQVAEPQAV